MPSLSLVLVALLWPHKGFWLTNRSGLLVLPHMRKFHRGLGTLWLHMWKMSSVLSERQAFQGSLQLRTSGAPLMPCACPSGPGSLNWCNQRNIDPCKTSVPRIPEFFPFLCRVLGLSVPVVKGYQPTLNHVFSVMGIALAASTIVSRMFRCFESSCRPREIRPLDWNLSLILGCLSGPSFDPLKLASDKHIT